MSNLSNLKKQIPFKWKAQSKTQNGNWTCVAYIDSRDVQELLDETVGPLRWEDSYKVVKIETIKAIRWIDKQKTFIDAPKYVVECTLTIIDEKGNKISKSDVGLGEDTEAEKSAYSDAFKRSAVKFGVGRFLYDKEIQYISDTEYQANKYKLTDYINAKIEGKIGNIEQAFTTPEWDTTLKQQEEEMKKQVQESLNKSNEKYKCKKCNGDTKIINGTTKEGKAYKKAQCLNSNCKDGKFISSYFINN